MPIKAAIDEALQAKEAGEERVILFNLSGHGHFDMAAYDAYLAGELTDVVYEPGAALAVEADDCGEGGGHRLGRGAPGSWIGVPACVTRPNRSPGIGHAHAEHRATSAHTCLRNHRDGADDDEEIARECLAQLGTARSSPKRAMTP